MPAQLIHLQVIGMTNKWIRMNEAVKKLTLSYKN